jgi:hypothetical protein
MGTSKVIFLDLDGVLNGERYLDSLEDIPFERYPEKWIDPAAVEVVNQIRSTLSTSSSIVLSSMWRYNFSLDEMNQFLRDRGLRGHITDMLPTTDLDVEKNQFRSMSEERGKLIFRWIREHWESLRGFVILDDLPANQFYPLGEYLVRTDRGVGLQKSQKSKVFEILGSFRSVKSSDR